MIYMSELTLVTEGHGDKYTIKTCFFLSLKNTQRKHFNHELNCVRHNKINREHTFVI